MNINNIIQNLGFEALNPMQEAMLSSKSEKRMLLAPTGAGKTLAYLLPCVERFEKAQQGTEIIIISPSRELAHQIDAVFRSMSTGESITCVFGGHSQRVERRSLEYVPRVVVGTPGRILDHLDKGRIDGRTVSHVIFDEFDKLLEMGFDEQMGQILGLVPYTKYYTLTSATENLDTPDYIYLDDFEKIDFLTGSASGELTTQKIRCTKDQRLGILLNILRGCGDEQVIIFCNFREQAEEISNFLLDQEVTSEFYHGGMEQFDREKSLILFKNKSANILVATDLAARGLDISTVKHIIHYELPNDMRAFTHRNGRTARVDRTGTAYVLLTDEVMNKVENGKPWKYDYVQSIEGKFTTVETSYAEIPAPAWKTIFFGRGKKDKVNKIDIMGFLCKQGGLSREDIGIIDVKDYHAYVAVASSKARDVVENVGGLRIKNMKARIYVEV